MTTKRKALGSSRTRKLVETTAVLSLLYAA